MKGQIRKANELLGYPYLLTGKIVHGKKIGGSLGFPTANIYPRLKSKLVPGNGIYAVKAEFQDSLYDGMLYIGKKPTLGENETRSIEINIFDFNQTIYGDTLKIHFVDFIRKDEKFNSMEELRDQLKKDKLAAVSILRETRANTQ